VTGLLVGADDVLVGFERFALPDAGVQVQHALGLGSEVRAVMKIQERSCQGLMASSPSQRRTVEAETGPVMLRAASSAASSGHDQRDSGVPASAGS
jgi:hypothetical protein